VTRTAVVTGGVSGLGEATARRLAADGVTVITWDISAAADIVVDVRDAQAVTAAAAQLGAIDILINSAGIVGPNKPLWEIADAEWATTMAVNLSGTFNMCRAFVPGMRERGWGRIVNSLTKSLGKELATSGVLVNAIAPAVIETPMNATTAPAVLEHLTALIPMRRMGRADEVAELVAWLASDKCSFSTGAVYDISGGRATY
jgi:NAD(P)-dependent dehydrogenase (short-subunit alcohol dehydrogenase family)